MTITCAHCSTPVPDDSKFCHQCGSLVSDAEGQAAATAAMDASATQKMESLLSQDIKGEYTLGHRLGKGGMAAVYLATETRLARKVAIKVLPPEMTFGHGIERFVREAKVSAALDHPNIIPIYRITSGDTIFWYAMKFIEGKALDEVLQEKHSLPLDQTIKILEPVADALDYAHDHKVVHRDIKPANIMMDERGRVTVTDFGIAKAFSEGTLTASGSVVGTPYYMSPEQGSGGGVTAASDQYSVAVMAYEMLSGERPFDGESAMEILLKHVSVLAPPLGVLRAALPKHVTAAVHKALSKKPQDRFKTVSAFVEGLKQPWEGFEATLEAVTEETRRTSGWRRIPTKALAPVASKKRLVVTAATVTVLAGVAGGAYWTSQQNNSRSGVTGTDTEQGTEVVSAPTPTDSVQDSVSTPRPTGDQPPAPVTSTTGQVTVAGLPAGGTISIDQGIPTRRTDFVLDTGLHTFTFEAPGFDLYADTFRVTAADTTTIEYPGRATVPVLPSISERTPVQDTVSREQPEQPSVQFGTLIVRTQGGWARMFVDGEFRTQSSVLRIDSLLPGTHVIRVEREGFQTIDTTLTVSEAETSRMTIQMRRQDE